MLHLMVTLTDRVTRLRDSFSTFTYAQCLFVHYVKFPPTLFRLLFRALSTLGSLGSSTLRTIFAYLGVVTP